MTAGDRTLTITAPDAARADVTVLTAPGRFAIYDWERSVLGPDGRPAPTDPAVTGGPGAGQEAALTEAEARSRAAQEPRRARPRGRRRVVRARGRPRAHQRGRRERARGRGPREAARPSRSTSRRPGKQAFTTLTRELAQRGADQAGAGDPLQTSQHLALVLDDRIVATPYINWREAPDGIDGADGAYMSDLATPEQARLTAALLSAGPLPGTLQLIR